MDMRSRALVFGGSSLLLATLALWAPALLAQDALATTVAVEASSLDTGDAGAGDFLHRYTPQANTFELGAFAVCSSSPIRTAFGAPQRTTTGP